MTDLQLMILFSSCPSHLYVVCYYSCTLKKVCIAGTSSALSCIINGLEPVAVCLLWPPVSIKHIDLLSPPDQGRSLEAIGTQANRLTSPLMSQACHPRTNNINHGTGSDLKTCENNSPNMPPWCGNIQSDDRQYAKPMVTSNVTRPCNGTVQWTSHNTTATDGPLPDLHAMMDGIYTHFLKLDTSVFYVFLFMLFLIKVICKS